VEIKTKCLLLQEKNKSMMGLLFLLFLGSALSRSSLDMYERAREELVWEDQSQRLGKGGASHFFFFSS
jgi:hypothetical protein